MNKTGDKEKSRRVRGGDIRQRGFADRASLEEAVEWIDGHSGSLRAEEIGLGEAAGRVLAAAVETAWAIPPVDRAAADGYAVRSADTVGAGDYNPLELALVEGADELPVGAAAAIVAGAGLPRGANSILPFELARERNATGNASLPAAGAGANAILPFEVSRANGANLEIFGAVAEGWGIEREGQQAQAGMQLAERGRVLRPQDIGVLASLGVERVQVVKRPRVRIVVSGPKRCGEFGGQGDANGPMLRALVERDGGIVVEAAEGRCLAVGFAANGAAPAAGAEDLTLVAGRSGTGVDDDAALAIAEVGELTMHGIALRPGDSAGLGVVGGAPLVLLPGDPLGCLNAYEMLAGRLIRRMGGRAEELPFEVVEAEVGRKIVSMIGVVDVCRVRFEGGKIEAIGSAESGGIVSAVRADGFVVVPAPLEGYAPGARVSVYVYGGGCGLGSLIRH